MGRGGWGGREGLFSFPDIFVAPQARATFSGKLSDLKKQAREQRLGGKLGENEVFGRGGAALPLGGQEAGSVRGETLRWRFWGFFAIENVV